MATTQDATQPHTPEPSTEGTFDSPIFVGGLGRSGSHPVGRMLNSSREFWQVRTEVRFIASPGGLASLHRGSVTMDDFTKRMRGFFWKRGHPDLQGLSKFTTEEEREEFLQRFQEGWDADPIAASRRLISDLLDRAARDADRPQWTELTAESIQEAPLLHQIYPNAKFVNMVRDGRAIAAGAACKLLNMTDDPIVALRRWERIITRAEKSIRKLPEDRILTIPFDEMVEFDRELWFGRLADFAGIEGKPRRRMQKFFDENISAERANVGRWRTRISPEDVRMVERHHRRAMRRLHKRNIDWVPDHA